MEFKKDKVYDFEYSRIKMYGCEPYMILKYNGSETLPGYEDDEWLFRAPLYDFQKKYDEERWVDSVVPCYVKGVNKMGLYNDKNTEFPILAQDKTAILKEEYKEGASYDFTIVEVLDENPERISYRVQDVFGFSHYLNPQAGNTSYQKGEKVSLRVNKIEKGSLIFAYPFVALLPNYFKQGEVYVFDIIEEEQARDGKGLFYVVKDKFPDLGALHRFHFPENRKDGPGDSIELRVKAFSTKTGFLVLEDPKKALLPPELERVAKLEDEDVPRVEGQHLEYKSSFVWTADKRCNIDEQLDGEIMSQIAAFLNADGGELRIGYDDNGAVKGINEDLAYLNTGSDPYNGKYDFSPDKIILKFNNRIKACLGKHPATKVSVDLFQSDGLLVCHIKMSKSLTPVWLKGTKLYVRCNNSSLLFTGDDITKFICERCGRNPMALVSVSPQQFVAEEQPVLPPAREDVIPVDKTADLSAFVSLPEADEKQAWKYITLYKEGGVSQQLKAVQRRAKTGEEVLYNIPVTADIKKRASKVRMLMIYDNGYVAVLNPNEVLKTKLSKKNKVYSNGYYCKDGAKLLQVLICRENDIMVVRSLTKDGKEMLKSVPVSTYNTRDALSMNAKGVMYLRVNQATPLSCHIISTELQPNLAASLNAIESKYEYGFAVDSANCMNIMAYLEKHGKTVKRIEY